MGSNQTMLMNNDKMHINERTSGPCERVTTQLKRLQCIDNIQRNVQEIIVKTFLN